MVAATVRVTFPPDSQEALVLCNKTGILVFRGFWAAVVYKHIPVFGALKYCLLEAETVKVRHGSGDQASF